MKSVLWRPSLGALLICVGFVACDADRAGSESARAPVAAPETTAPAQTPADTAATGSTPYATEPAVGETESMTGASDISGTGTTGDTLGDRCAGLTGEALTDCLEAESVRQQEMDERDTTEPASTEPVP